jgi:aldehyde:ferredoxin oxidoreductase
VGALPTKNFQSGFFKEMGEKLGPEAVKKLRVRNRACIQCPMACSNFLKVEEGPYAGSMVEGPEYETLALLGSNCNLSDLPAVVALNLLCDRMGMDVISTGNTLAWAMECYEKGILSKEDLDGVELRWGDSEAMITMVNKIARREGIGDLLAEGVKRASEKIGKGSERFAMQVKGLELPAYEPRAAISMPLAYATADRGGCHLRSWPIGVEVWGTFWLDADPEKGEKNIPIETERWNPEGKAYIVYRQQHHYGLKFSSIMCDFALPPISDPIADLVARATGWDDIRDRRELERTSERIINMTRLFNVREGLRRKDDEALPWRIFNEPIQDGPTKGVQIKYKDFKKMLEEYYELRQWDENGIPKKEKLIELGMEDLAEEVERL